MSKPPAVSYPPAVPYGEIVQARIGRDPEFATALLAEAMECFAHGETSIARSVVRDVIKGSIGYTELAKRTGTPETSLVRMFGPNGNPTFANVSSVISHLLAASGAELRVDFVFKSRKTTARRATSATRRPKPARQSNTRGHSAKVG